MEFASWLTEQTRDDDWHVAAMWKGWKGARATARNALIDEVIEELRKHSSWIGFEDVADVVREMKISEVTPSAADSAPIANVPIAGELVEDVNDGSMFVNHRTEATLYHELMRIHERVGGSIFKEAGDLIRAQRKRIFALESQPAHDEPEVPDGDAA